MEDVEALRAQQPDQPTEAVNIPLGAASEVQVRQLLPLKQPRRRRLAPARGAPPDLKALSRQMGCKAERKPLRSAGQPDRVDQNEQAQALARPPTRAARVSRSPARRGRLRWPIHGNALDHSRHWKPLGCGEVSARLQFSPPGSAQTAER